MANDTKPPVVPPVVGKAEEVPPVAPPAGQTVYAGKYQSPEELERGYREQRGALGVPVDDGIKLFGEGGMFSNVIALESAYKSDETILRSTRKQADEKPKPDDKKPGEQPKPLIPEPDDDPDPSEIFALSGLKAIDIEKQYNDHGKLSDEQYTAIKAAAEKKHFKLPRKMAESMMGNWVVAAQAANATAFTELSAVAGGDTELNTVMQWAKDHYPQEERDYLNRDIADPKRRVGAMKRIMADYSEDVGAARARPTVGIGSAHAAAGASIDSKDEYDEVRDKIKRGTASKAEISAFEAIDPQELILRAWKPSSRSAGRTVR